MTEAEKIMAKLLHLYDWNVRFTTIKETSDYHCGYADAIGQCILDIGKLLGEGHQAPYKYEAYKRVMEYDNTENYWKKYPKPIADYFPAETIRRNGGKL